MIEVGELRPGARVFVRAFGRHGEATVERVRKDGRVAVTFSGGDRATVRPDCVWSLSQPKASTPGVLVAAPIVVGASGRSVPKEMPVRDRAYLDWLKTQPCAACAHPHGCDPSHHGRHGVGTKPSDLGAIPLCRRCHDFWHNTGRVFGRESESAEATKEWLCAKAAEFRREYERKE